MSDRTRRALNEELLRGNTCFGCGPENPDGLRIRIFRDGDRDDRLVGEFHGRPPHSGFPHIVHGGLQFTALDCMAGWVMLVLRSPGRMVPLTRGASMRFHRPLLLGNDAALSAVVAKAGPTSRDPVVIHAEIRDDHQTLLSEADYEYVLLPEDRFRKLVNIDAMPDAYRRHFGDIP